MRSYASAYKMCGRRFPSRLNRTARSSRAGPRARRPPNQLAWETLPGSAREGGEQLPSSEYLNEIKAMISGEAQINSKDQSNGYPGIDGIKTCISKAYGGGDYGSVYWISAENIIAVTKTNYVKVSSSAAVTGTGFGANGSTYNNNAFDP